jgi:hypothetical protein
VAGTGRSGGDTRAGNRPPATAPLRGTPQLAHSGGGGEGGGGEGREAGGDVGWDRAVVGGGRGADGSSHHLITYKDDIYVGQFVIQLHFYEFI